MQLIHPADELADVRAELARLRTREAELRAVLLAMPPPMAQGRWFRAVVAERRSHHLNPAALPPSIRNDPWYWQERQMQVVSCLAVQARPAPRPGWPMQRGTPVAQTAAGLPAAPHPAPHPAPPPLRRPGPGLDAPVPVPFPADAPRPAGPMH